MHVKLTTEVQPFEAPSRVSVKTSGNMIMSVLLHYLDQTTLEAMCDDFKQRALAKHRLQKIAAENFGPKFKDDPI